MTHHAIGLALLSAALFGLSTPAAKVLLGTIDPTVLAGLLYCGAGSRLIVSQIVVDTLKALNLAYPTSSAERDRELKAIRKMLAT